MQEKITLFFYPWKTENVESGFDGFHWKHKIGIHFKLTHYEDSFLWGDEKFSVYVKSASKTTQPTIITKQMLHISFYILNIWHIVTHFVIAI